MSLGKGGVVSAGDWLGSDFSQGRLLATAALIGMTGLTAPEATILGVGRWVMPDILNTRAETAANRVNAGDDTADAANFLLPGVAGQGAGTGRDGGVLTANTGIGLPCRIQTFGVANMLGTVNGVAGNIAVGDFVVVAEGGGFANSRGCAVSLTPNTTTGLLTGPSAAAAGVVNGNSYTIIGQVMAPLPGTNGSNTVPQMYRVRLFGNNGAARVITGTA